jgi:hypothetical protein
MSYTIIKTNGDTLVPVPDTQLNTDYGITLVGRNYSGYGVFINDNFVHLMENFANSAAPILPLVGQLWMNTTTKLLSAWEGTNWKPLAFLISSGSTPATAGARIGDLWWDTTEYQMKVWSGQTTNVLTSTLPSTGNVVTVNTTTGIQVGDIVQHANIGPVDFAVVEQITSGTTVRITNPYTIGYGETVTFVNGSGWYIVGPSWTRSQRNTSISPRTVTDTNGIVHTIGLIYTNGKVLGVTSKDAEFTLAVASAIEGFRIIGPGITLHSTTAGRVVKTVTATAQGSSGETTIQLSSTENIRIGDYFISGNVAFSSGITVGSIDSANSTVTINTTTAVATGELVELQGGVDKDYMFNGTVSNALKLNNVTPDNYARRDRDETFLGDVSLATGNLYVGADNNFSIKAPPAGGDIQIDSNGFGHDISVYTSVATTTPRSATASIGAVLSNLISVQSTGNVFVGDIIVSGNVSAQDRIVVADIFSGNSQILLSSPANIGLGETFTLAGNRVRSLYINGGYGNVEVRMDPTSSLGVATKNYVDQANAAVTLNLENNVNTLIGPSAPVNRRSFSNISALANTIIATADALRVDVDLKAYIADPTFTGFPRAPTANQGDSSTLLATTEFVTTGLDDLDNKFTANALTQDAQILLRANIASPEFTGIPTVPSPASGDATRTLQIAHTWFVGNLVTTLRDYTDQQLALKAPLASPVLTGVPQSVTPTDSNVSTMIATTQYVHNKVTAANVLMLSVTDNLMSIKANLASPTLTGVPEAPTAPSTTSNSMIATTQFVKTSSPVLSVAGKIGNVALVVGDITGAAPIASPAFSGVPAVPTAPAGTANLQIASTAFVMTVANTKSPINNPTFTGIVTLGNTAPATDNTAKAASTGWVQTWATTYASVPYWSGSRKYISTAAPGSGDGADNDIWFQYLP